MRLIFNGDDFGLTKGCNEAIIDCFKAGILKSTSLMVNMPEAKQAAKLMKHYPELSVGIHFNITIGYPIATNVPTLIQADGTFTKESTKDLDQVRTELYAQMERFIELTGKYPTHINNHHWIECIEGVDDILEEIANTYQLPLRQFKTRQTHSPFEVPKLCLHLKEITQYFSKETINTDDVYEIVTHPGYIDEKLTQLSSLTFGRVEEAQLLRSNTLKQWLLDNNIEIITYEQLRN